MPISQSQKYGFLATLGIGACAVSVVSLIAGTGLDPVFEFVEAVCGFVLFLYAHSKREDPPGFGFLKEVCGEKKGVTTEFPQKNSLPRVT